MLLNTRVLALSIGLLLTMIASTQVSTISASTSLRDAAVVREMMATGRLDEPATQVAVVPIIVNAGTALLPTIMGALANLLSILFSPRALGQVLRRRWKVAVIAAASLVLAGALGIPLLRAAPSSRAAARAGGPPATEIDWAKVAENLIAQEGLHAAGDAPAREPTAPAEPVPGRVPADSPESVRLEAANAPSGEGTASPAGLRPIWSFQPEDAMFLGTAAIVGKRVYVAANQTDLGGYTGLLASLDLETGKPIWQVTDAGKDTLLPFFSSPAVTADGKYVVIGQGLHQDRKRLFIKTRERKLDRPLEIL
jgi:outer membrane protein assembly factor BamB